MSIETVGIVGAGQMGNGIAHVFALAGYDVVLNDIAQDSLDKAMATITRNLDLRSAVARLPPICAMPPLRAFAPR